MSFWEKVKKKGFSFTLFKISFSTGGKKPKVHSVRVPIIGTIGKKDDKKEE